jgi:hypothetical protein
MMGDFSHDSMQTGEISWGYTLWLFNIAMGNGPFVEVYLLKMVIFHGYVK